MSSSIQVNALFTLAPTTFSHVYSTIFLSDFFHQKKRLKGYPSTMVDSRSLRLSALTIFLFTLLALGRESLDNRQGLQTISGPLTTRFNLLLQRSPAEDPSRLCAAEGGTLL
jgi:hypothetical protein